MPGPYTHITLLYELTLHGKLEILFSKSSGFADVFKKYFSYCVLGAVSPDYPNLVQGGIASQWADAMHYTRVCNMITSGINISRSSTGTVRDKQLAWLLGYSAHVVTDMTVHPVVQAKVGVYAENQRHHRVCEMNQDSYIYRRMGLGEIGVTDMFAQMVARCSEPANSSQLDPGIITLWEEMLECVHPELFAAKPPDCSLWHREFVAKVNECADSPIRLFPLAANISAKMGLSYPAYDSVDMQYIDKQTIPSEIPFYRNYDEIFDSAVNNVASVWKQVEQAICDADMSPLPIFGEWNLDNGLNEQGRLVFWE